MKNGRGPPYHHINWFSRRIPGNQQYQYLTNLNATTMILFFLGGANQDVDEHYLTAVGYVKPQVMFSQGS